MSEPKFLGSIGYQICRPWCSARSAENWTRVFNRNLIGSTKKYLESISAATNVNVNLKLRVVYLQTCLLQGRVI